MGQGNRPTNVGGGTVETTSAPSPTPTASAGVRTTRATREAGEGSLGAPPAPTDVTLSPEDFKRDGTLRKDAVRRLQENVPPRGAERSFNEVTNETTVTTTVNGATVTFVEEGDTRAPARETAMDSLARAQERAESKENE